MIFIFWISLVALLHSYVLYPFLMRFLAKGKQENDVRYKAGEEWPRVFVLMSLYNEEQVIQQKLQSLLDQDYPKEKLYCFIGSDCSDDRTNELVQEIAAKHINIIFFPFTDRRGKPGVINELVRRLKKAFPLEEEDIFVITDANVILSKGVITNLAQHFKNEDIGLVDAHMIHTGMQKEGISKVEDQYISSEVKLKYWESLVGGNMVGPFGGCYAVKAKYFTPVPNNYLVDDFYIAMKVFEQGKKAINELNAQCFEDVSHEIGVEYRRKRRISAGNYQNLVTFWKLWWPPFKLQQFAFFSHKVLRWWGPFFLLLLLVSAIFLSLQAQMLYTWSLGGYITVMLFIPLIDWGLSALNLNISLFRSIRYFVLMNLALLEGFWKYLKGIKSNVWQPTKRN